MADIYRAFDPSHPTPADQEDLRILSSLDREKPFVITGFTRFSIALHLGFRRLTYSSASTSRGYFWINSTHAEHLGRLLQGGGTTPPRNMAYLCISMTMFEAGGAVDRLVNTISVAPTPIIDELCIKHVSGDEATIEEAEGLARLVTCLRVRIFHWWSGEFDYGAVDAFCVEMERLNNTSLVEHDVCDVSQEAPNDRIVPEKLENLVLRNRAAANAAN